MAAKIQEIQKPSRSSFTRSNNTIHFKTNALTLYFKDDSQNNSKISIKNLTWVLRNYI